MSAVLIGFILLAVFGVAPNSVKAAGASLLFSPSQGTYQVNNTFDISVLVNSGNQSINAVEVFISFPPDKLQVVNPTIGKSFIEVWIAGPSFSNSEGKISFQGGLPNPGINTSAGVISTIQFRVKSSGSATLKFSDKSKVLANDGNGTNILTSKGTATYNLALAPPEGPIVSSPSHPDQNRWYQKRSIDFAWEEVSDADQYAYSFDTNPSTLPDKQKLTKQLQLTIEAKSDGIWYFHIIAQRGGSWSGASHYSVKIDATSPATFTPKMDKKRYMRTERPLAHFNTTDATSGIDHYEVKVIDQSDTEGTTSFFTEQQSPYQLTELPEGKYRFVVRAYDLAGNFTDGIVNFEIGSYQYLGLLWGFNPVLIAVIGILLLVIVIWLFVAWLSHRKTALSAKRLQDDLAELTSQIRQKQLELERLLSLQESSNHRLSQLKKPPPPLS